MTVDICATDMSLTKLGDGRRVHGAADVGFGVVIDADIASAVARTGRPWVHDTCAVILDRSKGCLAVRACLLAKVAGHGDGRARELPGAFHTAVGA